MADEIEVGVLLTLKDRLSDGMMKATKKIDDSMTKIAKVSLLTARLISSQMRGIGGQASRMADEMVAAYGKTNAAAGRELDQLNQRMLESKAVVGKALIPAYMAANDTAASLARSLGKLPKPLQEGIGLMWVFGAQALSAAGQIGGLAVTMIKLARAGWLTKTNMIQLGYAMGATFAIVGAITTESDELRIILSAVGAAMVVLAAKTWIANIATMFQVSLWTAGIGVGIAVAAAIYGISAALHASNEAAAESSKGMGGYTAALTGSAGALDSYNSSLMASAYAYSNVSTSTAQAIGATYTLIKDAAGNMVLGVTDAYGRMTTVTLTAVEGMANTWADKYGNIYTITTDANGKIIMAIEDAGGQSLGVISLTVANMNKEWGDGMGNIYKLTDNGMGLVTLTLTDPDGRVISSTIGTMDAILAAMAGGWVAIQTDTTSALGVLAGLILTNGGSMGQPVVDSLEDINAVEYDVAKEHVKGLFEYIDSFTPKNIVTFLFGSDAYKALFDFGAAIRSWHDQFSVSGQASDDPALMGMPTGAGASDWKWPWEAGWTAPWGDVLWRSGEDPIGISSDDNIMAFKGDVPPGAAGGGGIQIHIGSIVASSYEAGRAAGRGLMDELARRGIAPLRG